MPASREAGMRADGRSWFELRLAVRLALDVFQRNDRGESVTPLDFSLRSFRLVSIRLRPVDELFSNQLQQVVAGAAQLGAQEVTAGAPQLGAQEVTAGAPQLGAMLPQPVLQHEARWSLNFGMQSFGNRMR